MFLMEYILKYVPVLALSAIKVSDPWYKMYGTYYHTLIFLIMFDYFP